MVLPSKPRRSPPQGSLPPPILAIGNEIFLVTPLSVNTPVTIALFSSENVKLLLTKLALGNLFTSKKSLPFKCF